MADRRKTIDLSLAQAGQHEVGLFKEQCWAGA